MRGVSSGRRRRGNGSESSTVEREARLQKGRVARLLGAIWPCGESRIRGDRTVAFLPLNCLSGLCKLASTAALVACTLAVDTSTSSI
ncbi:hypothetical protein J1614_007614 [Plenodomus biglobosus]|nr:hypothetical protein J1614_007614 [Plenodomus biglobosus]